MSKPPPLRPVKVSPTQLRTMFAEDKIEERAAGGDLSIIVLKNHGARPELRMEPGTQSQLIAYANAQGNHVATAHRYLKPGGTLAASGRPDPKSLVRGDTLYSPWWGTAIGQQR